MVKRELVTEVLINPIIRPGIRYFRQAYPHTRDILVSEVGGSDCIGLISSGYDRKIRDNIFTNPNPVYSH
jgi:hypothetical protein